MEPVFPCLECSRKGKHQEFELLDLEEHLGQHHFGGMSLYTCPKCKQDFVTKAKASEHMKIICKLEQLPQTEEFTKNILHYDSELFKQIQRCILEAVVHRKEDIPCQSKIKTKPIENQPEVIQEAKPIPPSAELKKINIKKELKDFGEDGIAIAVKSDHQRTQLPIKKKPIDHPEVSKRQLEPEITSSIKGQGSEPALTLQKAPEPAVDEPRPVNKAAVIKSAQEEAQETFIILKNEAGKATVTQKPQQPKKEAQAPGDPIPTETEASCLPSNVQRLLDIYFTNSLEAQNMEFHPQQSPPPPPLLNFGIPPPVMPEMGARGPYSQFGGPFVPFGTNYGQPPPPGTRLLSQQQFQGPMIFSGPFCPLPPPPPQSFGVLPMPPAPPQVHRNLISVPIQTEGANPVLVQAKARNQATRPQELSTTDPNLPENLAAKSKKKPQKETAATSPAKKMEAAIDALQEKIMKEAVPDVEKVTNRGKPTTPAKTEAQRARNARRSENRREHTRKRKAEWQEEASKQVAPLTVEASGAVPISPIPLRTQEEPRATSPPPKKVAKTSSEPSEKTRPASIKAPKPSELRVPTIRELFENGYKIPKKMKPFKSSPLKKTQQPVQPEEDAHVPVADNQPYMQMAGSVPILPPQMAPIIMEKTFTILMQPEPIETFSPISPPASPAPLPVTVEVPMAPKLVAADKQASPKSPRTPHPRPRITAPAASKPSARHRISPPIVPRSRVAPATSFDVELDDLELSDEVGENEMAFLEPDVIIYDRGQPMPRPIGTRSVKMGSNEVEEAEEENGDEYIEEYTSLRTPIEPHRFDPRPDVRLPDHICEYQGCCVRGIRNPCPFCCGYHEPSKCATLTSIRDRKVACFLNHHCLHCLGYHSPFNGTKCKPINCYFCRMRNHTTALCTNKENKKHRQMLLEKRPAHPASIEVVQRIAQRRLQFDTVEFDPRGQPRFKSRHV